MAAPAVRLQAALQSIEIESGDSPDRNTDLTGGRERGLDSLAADEWPFRRRRREPNATRMNDAVVIHPPGRAPFATLRVEVSFGFAVCRQVGRVDAARGAERRHKQSDHRWGGHRVGDRAGMIGGRMIADLVQRLGKRPAGYAATPEVGLDRCAGGGEGVSPQ